MAWIKSYQELKDHPKLLHLCEKTGYNKAEAIGYLQMFWWWVLAYAEDGDLQKFNGNLKIDGLKIEDLKDCGFVDEDEKVHDWLDYAGRYLDDKYHARNPKKLKSIVRKYKTGKYAKCTRTIREQSALDKIRRDKIRKDYKPPIIPLLKNKSENFQKTWIAFLQMRKAINKKATEHAQELLLKRLDELAPGNENKQIDILNQSIIHSWQGLFDLKGDYRGQRKEGGTGNHAGNKYAGIGRTINTQ